MISMDKPVGPDDNAVTTTANTTIACPPGAQVLQPTVGVFVRRGPRQPTRR